MRDYAEAHLPVSDIFTLKSEAASLSQEQLENFQRDGYVIGNRLLDDSQIETLRAELAELMQPGHDGQNLWYEYHSNESNGHQNNRMAIKRVERLSK